MSHFQNKKKKQHPDLIHSKAASNLLKLSEKEKTKKHKDAAKTLFSLHKQAVKQKTQEQRPDIFDLKAAELLQKFSKTAAKQTETKHKHKQAAQSLMSLSVSLPDQNRKNGKAHKSKNTKRIHDPSVSR
jgi:acyl-CoA-binding protein